MTGPTRTTRRRLLGGCGVGLAALSGCSGLPDLGGGDGDHPGYDRDALAAAVGDPDSLLPPDAFPVGIPAALQDRHRERARTYLADVPAAPSFPNEEIATQLAERRSTALENLQRDVSGRPRRRLETWRDRRVEAATVRGAYLAASGDVGRRDVADERDRVRSTLASFEADWAYRATDPVAAAVVHETFERYVDACRERLTGRARFPREPGDAVFRSGETLGDLEAARAHVVDAGRLRAQHRQDAASTGPHRTTLAAAAARLRRSLSATTSDHRKYLETGTEAVDRDLQGTPGAALLDRAASAVEWRREQSDRARRQHAPATGVVETGRALVATGALDAVVDAIREGRFTEWPPVEDVEARYERARDALDTAWAATPQSLAVELAKPALRSLRRGARQIRDVRPGLDYAIADVVHAEAQARAVPAAATFVERRLTTERTDRAELPVVPAAPSDVQQGP